MRYRFRSTSYMQPGFGGGLLPPGIKVILIVNALVFLLQMISGPGLINAFGLRASDVWTRGFIWQLGTYMWLHGGFFHILFNLFALWMFGRNLELSWGTRAFMKYYLVTGIGAGVITVLIPLNMNIPVIGASGAVLAVLFAYARTWPNNPIYIYFLFPVPAKYFVGFLIIVDLLAVAGRPGAGNVAHITHLGGVLIGFLYMLRNEGKLKFPSPFGWLRNRRLRRKKKRARRKLERNADFMAEVDRVLDRINEVGYEGLTEKEKETLNKASAKLSETE